MTAARRWSTGTSRSASARGSPATGPRSSRDEADAVVAELREDADRSTGPGPRLHRARRRRARPRRCSSSTGRAGSRPTPTASTTCSRPLVDEDHREEGRARPASAGHRLAGHRRRGRRAARLPGVAGARPVRPVPRPGRPAAAGRARTSSTSSASSASTRTTSGSGCACTRRPTGCSSPRCRGCATTSSARSSALAEHRRADPAARRGLKRVGEARQGRQRRQPARRARTPEQKEIVDRLTGVMSLLEGHADVVMDGVGPAVIPTVDADPHEVHQPPQGRRASTSCCAGCSASTPRWRSTATAPTSSAASSTRSAWTTSTRSGPSRPTCRPRPRSPTRTPGSPASMIEVAVSLDPAVAAVRGSPYAAARRRRPGAAPVAGRLLGRRRLAGPARGRRLRGAASGRWRVVGVTVDHGLQDGSAERGRRASSTQMAALGADETASVRVTRRRRPGRARRRPRGQARYAVLERAAPSASAPPSCCSATPATTRPRPCCSGWPAAPAAARSPACAAAFGRLRRPLLDVTRAQTERGLPGRGHRAGGTTRTTTTRRSPGSRVRHTVLPLLEDELGPGVAEALARTADLLRDDAEHLDDARRRRRTAT